MIPSGRTSPWNWLSWFVWLYTRYTFTVEKNNLRLKSPTLYKYLIKKNDPDFSTPEMSRALDWSLRLLFFLLSTPYFLASTAHVSTSFGHSRNIFKRIIARELNDESRFKFVKNLNYFLCSKYSVYYYFKFLKLFAKVLHHPTRRYFCDTKNLVTVSVGQTWHSILSLWTRG